MVLGADEEMRWRRRRLALTSSAIGLLTALALVVLPGGALGRGANASRIDVSASHTYVVADNALARESAANIPKVKRLITRYKERLKGECRKIAAGSPQNSESWHMSYEIAGALWSLSFGADSRAIHRFAHTVDRLRWSDPAIAHKVRRYAKTLVGLAALPMPHVCSDVMAWKESGYETVPAYTLHFDAHAEALEPYVLPVSLIEPYLEASEKTIVQKTQRLERKLLNTETSVGGNAWFALVEALDLNT
jgi:hypothetical protein